MRRPRRGRGRPLTGAGILARVYPLVTTRAVDRPFDYAVGEGPAPERGTIVEVELGARRVRGVVAECPDAEPDGELKPLLGERGRIPAALVDLAEWVAAAYGSTVARALALAVPAEAGAPREPAQVRLVRTEGATARQAAILRHLAGGPLPLPELLERAGAARGTLKRMAERGLVVLERPEPGGAPPPAESAPALVLTDEQDAAVAACLEAAGAGGGEVLLQGVTGSGKTEVYLRVIAALLERGGGAIVLVPEIALTPQTAERFRARFGPTVAVLHSGLSAGRRAAEQRRIAAGGARVVVGARSAVFAPLPRLAAVVVDEEHDASYKHEADPRYDARAVAARRARMEGAVCIFGSATPRPEAWHGIARRVRLSARIGGRLPAVSVVDLRADGGYPLTRPLLDALAGVEERGARAILLLNRRGAAGALHCRTCARTWRCPRCDVALVLHGALLRCHHCGHGEPRPAVCPRCGSVDIARIGAGTAALERLVGERFPRLAVLRLDADAAAPAGEPEATLARFRAAAPAVLVGTQLVAKGHDVPGVELAAVIDADLGLALPDFRAEERTFALLTQLAGRPGRPGDPRGRVIVQTWDPDLRPVALAARHAVEEFLVGELERRRELGYPPFRRLARLLVSAPTAALARDVAGHVATAARPALDGDELLGPAPLPRLRDRGRSHVLVKTAAPRRAAAVFRGLLRELSADLRRTDASVVLDVDPQSFG